MDITRSQAINIIIVDFVAEAPAKSLIMTSAGDLVSVEIYVKREGTIAVDVEDYIMDVEEVRRAVAWLNAWLTIYG